MTDTQTFPTVLVGVDGSNEALQAVGWAAAEAARRQAPLRLVHAFAWVAESDLVSLTGGTAVRDELIGRARGYLDAAAATARRLEPGLTVQQEVVFGFPAEVLAAEARGAGLLVLGDRGLSRIEGVLVGSTAAALAVHAPCPVVVVRGAEVVGEASRTRPVVVGVDDSSSSEEAIAFAFEAAAARSVPLVAVHAYPMVVGDPMLGGLVERAAVAEHENRRLAAHLAAWIEKFPGVTVRQQPALDGPVHRLVALSEDAQLVVVGSRGRGQLAGLLLGSVSNALMHKAACPVAVVRSTAAPH